MGLYQKIETDMKTALKEGDSLRLSVLRMLISAIKTFEIDRNVKSAEEADILQMIQRQVKQHRESIEGFKKGNRPELADKEQKELVILGAYMPKQLSEEELMAIVRAAIAETGAIKREEVGKVMKAVMEKAGGRCDGRAVNQLVMGLLK